MPELKGNSLSLFCSYNYFFSKQAYDKLSRKNYFHRPSSFFPTHIFFVRSVNLHMAPYEGPALDPFRATIRFQHRRLLNGPCLPLVSTTSDVRKKN